MVREIYYQPYKFEYDTETRILKSLNGHVKISDVPESEIDQTLEMLYFTFCPSMRINIISSYDTLIKEYEMALVF